MNDWLEWFPLLLWLPAALIFLLVAAAAWLAPRILRLRVQAGWRRQAASSRPSLRLLVAGGMALLVAVLLFAASGGEELRVRLAAMTAGAVVVWLAVDFGWRAARNAARRRALLEREWARRAARARAELLAGLGQGHPEAVACRVLRDQLGAERVWFFAPDESGYVCRASSPEGPPDPPVWSRDGALATALGLPPAHLPLRLAGPDGAVRLSAAVRTAEVLQEEARLAGLGASAAAPVIRGAELEGFFLAAGLSGGEPYGTHHLTFLEDFARSYPLIADAAQNAAQLIRKAEETARREARQAAVQLALSLVQPPEAADLPDLDYAGTAENRGECRVFYDTVPLPGRAVAFAAAELDAGLEEAAIRIIQLQALLRTRARAYHEDLAELVASTRRALDAPGARWPQVRLFLAVYRSGTRRLHYVNAGFFPPFLLRRTMEGAEVLRLRHTGPPLAAETDLRCEEAEAELAPGDLLVAVSSTVPAAVNAQGEAWGEVRLIEALDGWKPAPAPVLLQQTVAAWEAFTAPPARRPPALFLLLRPRV